MANVHSYSLSDNSFSPQHRRICCLFLLRTHSHILPLAKLGTSKTQQNKPEMCTCTHRAPTKHKDLPLKVLDMLALRTSYKPNTCTIKKYIFFLLSHSKAPNYWPPVKMCNAWAVMQDHTQLRPQSWGELFRIQPGHSSQRWGITPKSASHVKASETWSAFTGPSILPVLWLRKI